jgi:hypothetical protein
MEHRERTTSIVKCDFGGGVRAAKKLIILEYRKPRYGLMLGSWRRHRNKT